MPKKLINALFQKRDKAVAKKDKKLFLSTQLKNLEIKNSYSTGYFKLSKIKSKVLHLDKDDKKNNSWIAFVKEEYYQNDKFSHKGYLMYKLIKDNNRFVVHDIVW
ncbi:hypothetical protein HY637_00690 [Candidatus Woesearchaeota archaeon]|nr:hypothetical protein [Candidatus Woesearchaeota archaeon]